MSGDSPIERVGGSWWGALVVVAGLVALSACAGGAAGSSGGAANTPVELSNGGYYENNGVTEAEAFAAQDELMALPSLEEGIVIAENMLAEIQAALDAAIGERAWEVQAREDHRISTGACGGDYQLTNGSNALLHLDGTPPISDGEWEAAMAALLQVARPYGFVDRHDYWEGPGGHTSSLSDEHTADVTMLTEDKRQVIAVTVDTGCRFTDAQKALVRTHGVPFDPTDPDDHSPWPFPTPDPTRFRQ